MTIWFTHSLLAVVCTIYLIYKNDFKNIISDFRTNTKIIFSQSILDNVAWISFAIATTYISISITTAISESYVTLAVLLGIFINREKLRLHQIIGVVLTIGGVIFLSLLT